MNTRNLMSIVLVLGLALVGLALALSTDRAAAQGSLPAGLVLWNKLGSQAEIENSEVGPDGFFDNAEGQLTFAPGQFGDGVRYPFYVNHGSSINKVAFDLSSTGLTTEKGAIEFWWIAGYTDNTYFGDNGYRFFLSTADTVIHPPNPPKSAGTGQYHFVNDNFVSSRPNLKVYVGEHATGNFAIAPTDSSRHDFDEGDVIHWAIAYDVNGIDGTGETIMLFKNGVEIAHSTETWPVVPVKALWLGVMNSTWYNQNTRQLGYGSAAGVYDNLIIWDYAKTDYSDRFDEVPGRGLVLWNKLGAQAEIENSEVGLDGTFLGGSFVEGMFGNAFSVTGYVHHDNTLVRFPKEVIPTDAGAIEVWAKLAGFPSSVGYGHHPGFFRITDGYSTFQMIFDSNNGAGHGGLCGTVGHGFHCGTGGYGGGWTYEGVLGPGQAEEWHHYALVWDKNGIPRVADGTKKVAVFLDGQLNCTRWNDYWGSGSELVPLTGGELGLVYNWASYGTVAVDNIRIWDFAKTDFSDRFSEAPDSDGDGVPDDLDAFPFDPSEWSDNDGDGTGDNADLDDDNDGQSDADEIACGSDPLDASSTAPDADGDYSPDCVDADDDNDGVDDTSDNAPLHFNPDQSDIDGDGVGDVADDCPNDATNTCDPNGSAAAFIDSETGGSLSTEDGSVSITIPPDALEEDASISITDTDGGISGFELTTNKGQALGVFAVDLQPPQSLDPPVTIVFAWNDVDNDGKVDGTHAKEENLFITKDNGEITAKCKDEPTGDGTLPDCDQAANTFTFQVDSWSEFTLAYPKDTDEDEVPDDYDGVVDNCLLVSNPDQADSNADGQGDACDPVVGTITTPLDPILVGTSINVSASFSDADDGDNHTAMWDWGDGTTAGTVDQTENTVSDSHTYDAAGIYTIKLTVTDENGGPGESIYQFIVIYDPEGGFVTGGGWIWSPEGACQLDGCDSDTTGKANFGFFSKYKKLAAVPTGNIQFQFKSGNLNFHSKSYQWLVVAGHKAMFKGVGTINGTGNYGFLISAIDGALTPSTDADLFRIKIWDMDNGDAVVYDNQIGSPDDADPTTAIGGGNIVIHKRR